MSHANYFCLLTNLIVEIKNEKSPNKINPPSCCSYSTAAWTGRDYSHLKGVIVANGILDQVFNAFARVLPQVRQDPNSNLLCRGIHAVFGITAATLITKLGDRSLFNRQLV